MTAGVIAAHYKSGLTLPLVDSFDRPDSVNSLGTTSDGQLEWETLSGAMGIASGLAYAPSAGRAVLQTGASDGTVQVIFYTTTTFAGLIFRVVDNNNFLYMRRSGATQTLRFTKVVNGSETQIVDTGTGASSGALLKAVMSGTSITIYRDTTAFGPYTVTEHATATKHGLRADNTTARFNDFYFA